MDEIDTVVVFSLFVFRIGIPLLITFALTYLIDRFMTGKRIAKTDDMDIQAMDRLTPSSIPCWETKECLAERRSTCQAIRRPGVPCWLTKQLINGHLPDDCLDCPMFHSIHARTQHIAV